jgi:hypothetical protein
VIRKSLSLISLKTASNTNTSYIIPRNNNLYITAPSATSPFSSGTIPSGGPTNAPYFAAGSSFTNAWGDTASGIGLYTGAYTGTSDPFITLSKDTVSNKTNKSIQLSASSTVGIVIDNGGSTNATSPFTSPTVLIYTGTDSTYKPSLSYGAWATFANGQINLSATANNFINIATTGIILQAATSSGTSGNYSQILLDTAGAVTIQGKGTASTYTPVGSSRSYSNPTLPYLKINNQGIQMTSFPYLGDLSDTLAGNPNVGYNQFIRMIIQSPYTDSSGQSHVVTGPAIYYYQTTTPVSGGLVGDLWITY